MREHTMYTITITAPHGENILKPLKSSDWSIAAQFFRRASRHAERLTGNGIAGGEPLTDTRIVVRLTDEDGDVMTDIVENGRILVGA